VHDALLDVTERVQTHAELCGVVAQRLNLRAAGEIGDRLVDVERWGVVVFRRDRQVGPAHRPPGEPEAVEGLWARDLVHEVQVDVDEVWRAVFAFGDEVGIPHFFSEGLRSCGHVQSPG
jgi:hypothetical protein